MKFFFCSLFICFSDILCAQQRFKADSLLQVLEHTSGKDRVETLRHLSRSYIGADKVKSLEYARESVVEAEKLNNDTFLVRSLNNLSGALQHAGERQKSLQYIDRGIEITRKNGNKVQLVECLGFKATAYGGMKQIVKALPYAQEALMMP